MAGGTHAFDMIKTIKNNKILKKHNYFKNKQVIKNKLSERNIDFKTATKEEILMIHEQIVSDQKKEISKSIIALVISIIIVVSLFLFVSKFI